MQNDILKFKNHREAILKFLFFYVHFLIMNFIHKINPMWPLRLGLGLMYLYSGYDIFYHPQSWVWAVPQWFRTGVELVIPLTAYLRMQGAVEFLVGLLLLAWFSGTWGVRIAALFATLEMAAILLFTGIDPITFRDIGLLGASLALLVISFQSSSRQNEFQTV